MTNKKIKFVVAGTGFGDILILIETILKNSKNHDFLGFIDDDKKKRILKIDKYKVIGNWKLLKKSRLCVFNSVAKNPRLRIKAYLKLKSFGAKFINLIDPNVNTKFTKLGKGIAIFNDVFLGTNTKIGSQSIIHCFSSIGHDVKIGKNCFIAPGAKILGGTKIGDNVVVGSNSVCLPNTIIKSNSVIGAGSTVGGKIPANSTMFNGFAKKII